MEVSKSSGEGTKHDPYAAFRYPAYSYFVFGRSFTLVAVQMQVVAVSYDLYQKLHLRMGQSEGQSAMGLGMVGLTQVIPVLLFALPAGTVADWFSRRTVTMVTQLVMAFCVMAMLALSVFNGPVYGFYAILFLNATARIFAIPAVSSLFSILVPLEVLPNASTWNTSLFQLCGMVGPALGGVLIWDVGVQWTYIANLALMSIGFALITKTVPIGQIAAKKTSFTMESLVEGVRFVFRQRIILATFTLDLFAVLLGGATALLPILADLVHATPRGFGLMRAAPAAGAVVMALLTAHLPPWKKPGWVMLRAFIVFGIATGVLGLSGNFWLSMAALFVIGAADNVSVVVRQTLIQILTPNEMRGRVASVGFIFISCSNDLGEYESGVTASWWGTEGSVVFGGLGTILVAALCALGFPELRRVGKLNDLKPLEK